MSFLRLSPLGSITRSPLTLLRALCTSPSTAEYEPDRLYKHIIVETRGHDKAVLRSYETFASLAAKHLGLEIARTWAPRWIWWMRTQLRGAFVHKKYRTQYETRTHFRCWQIERLTGSTADTYLEYIQRNLPEGVAMKVTRCELQPLPDYIHPPADVQVEIPQLQSLEDPAEDMKKHLQEVHERPPAKDPSLGSRKFSSKRSRRRWRRLFHERAQEPAYVSPNDPPSPPRHQKPRKGRK